MKKLFLGLGLLMAGGAYLHADEMSRSNAQNQHNAQRQAEGLLVDMKEKPSIYYSFFNVLRGYLEKSGPNYDPKTYDGETISHIAAHMAALHPQESIGLFKLHAQHTESKSHLNEKARGKTPNDILEKHRVNYCDDKFYHDYDDFALSKKEKCSNIKKVLAALDPLKK